MKACTGNNCPNDPSLGGENYCTCCQYSNDDGWEAYSTCKRGHQNFQCRDGQAIYYIEVPPIRGSFTLSDEIVWYQINDSLVTLLK